MPQEGCRDCKLDIDEIQIRHEEENCGSIKYLVSKTSAHFICNQCGVDEIISVSFENIDRYAKQSALLHGFNTMELFSPGRELQAEMNKIRLTKCPLQAGLHNSLPI